MTIKIDEIGRRIVLELNPDEYWLKKVSEERDLAYYHCGEYCLSHKIDMDYKGKPPQEGMPQIFLTEEEAEKLRGLVDEIV